LDKQRQKMHREQTPQVLSKGTAFMVC